MNKLPAQQKGASAIVTIIILAAFAYAVYVGIQYVPQAIESRSVDSVLESVETDQKTNPATTEYDARAKVIRYLQINEMNDMVKNVSVNEFGGKTTIKIAYDRELNLMFKTHQMHHEKTLVLK